MVSALAVVEAWPEASCVARGGDGQRRTLAAGFAQVQSSPEGAAAD